MAATGIYWLALSDKLAAVGIEVELGDPHGGKAGRGRKRDWLACQWLQKLPAYGLWSRAFRPEAPIRKLRPLPRPRAEGGGAAASLPPPLAQARGCLHRQLGLGGSDLAGATGRAIIRAILAGKRDPEVLGQPRNARGPKARGAELKPARRGHSHGGALAAKAPPPPNRPSRRPGGRMERTRRKRIAPRCGGAFAAWI